MRLLFVILLCSVSLTLFSLELQPLKASKEVGSFILKMRFSDNFNLKKLPAMDFAVKDGVFACKADLSRLTLLPEAGRLILRHRSARCGN